MTQPTPTKPGPGETVTESEFLPDPEATVKHVKGTPEEVPNAAADPGATG